MNNKPAASEAKFYSVSVRSLLGKEAEMFDGKGRGGKRQQSRRKFVRVVAMMSQGLWYQDHIQIQGTHEGAGRRR